MRFFLFVLCVMLAGCAERRPEPRPRDFVGEANSEAGVLAHQLNWKVIMKGVGPVDADNRTSLKLTLQAPEIRTSGNLRGEIHGIIVYQTHLFYKEFDALKVGDTTSLIHLASVDDSHTHATSSYLAPHCKRAVEYAEKHSGGGY